MSVIISFYFLFAVIRGIKLHIFCLCFGAKRRDKYNLFIVSLLHCITCFPMLLVASCDYISRSCNVQCTWITVRDRDLLRVFCQPTVLCVCEAFMKFSFTLVNWRSAASVQIPTSHWRVVVDIICHGVPAAARSPCDLCWTCDPPASLTCPLSPRPSTAGCRANIAPKVSGHLVSSFPAPSPCRTLCFCDEQLTGLWNTGVYLLYCFWPVRLALGSHSIAPWILFQYTVKYQSRFCSSLVANLKHLGP